MGKSRYFYRIKFSRLQTHLKWKMHPCGDYTGARRATRTHTDAHDSPAGQIEECVPSAREVKRRPRNGSRGYARSTLEDRFSRSFVPSSRSVRSSHFLDLSRESCVPNEVGPNARGLKNSKFSQMRKYVRKKQRTSLIIM